MRCLVDRAGDGVLLQKRTSPSVQRAACSVQRDFREGGRLGGSSDLAAASRGPFSPPQAQKHQVLPTHARDDCHVSQPAEASLVLFTLAAFVGHLAHRV